MKERELGNRRYSSEEVFKVEIGNPREFMNVSIINADIPLLIGLDYQRKWEMVLDINRKY